MAAYLPRDYDPIPDALLHNRADLIDVTRRIGRNQNWIWANHGAVFAAFGQEPMTAQEPSVTGASQWLACAYFACPNRSATGSEYVRCCGYVTTSGASIDAEVVLYQLLPGETVPTVDSPGDVTAVTTIGADQFFDFDARIRSGGSMLRFVLVLRSSSSSVGTLQLLTCTVTWKPNPASVLGETVAPWQAISQAYVTPDRPASALLWRMLSNRTLKLIAENPRPIFSHSFIWPRIPTNATGAETRVAIYTVRHDGLTTSPVVRRNMAWLVTGQNAIVLFTVYFNGVAAFSLQVSQSGAPVNGVYQSSGTWAYSHGSVSMPSGDVKVEITAQCTQAATSPPTYCTNVGGVLLGFSLFQAEHTASQLGLPGSETVPTAYEPIDDAAVMPGRSVVAQDDRLGRRAGPYYLVRNLLWLAANRTAHTLIADWLHRTQTGGTGSDWTVASPAAGDGYYRNQTLFPKNEAGAFTAGPQGRDIVPWADRPDPTNTYAISAGGHHYAGDVLGRFYCAPLNGGKVAAILRPDVLYPTWSPPQVVRQDEDCLLRGYLDSTMAIEVEPRSENCVGGFLSAAPLGPRASVGDVLSFLVYPTPYSGWLAGYAHAYQQVALLAGYVYEAPLTQDDLDALA